MSDQLAAMRPSERWSSSSSLVLFLLELPAELADRVSPENRRTRSRPVKGRRCLTRRFTAASPNLSPQSGVHPRS